MRTPEEIKERILAYEQSITRLTNELNEEDSKQSKERRSRLIHRAVELKWVLDVVDLYRPIEEIYFFPHDRDGIYVKEGEKFIKVK